MVIAPLAIMVLRIYIELQLRHLRRLKRMMVRFNVRGPLKLSAHNHFALAVAGLVAIHIMPVFTIAFLGRHASAVDPDYTLALYSLAARIACWSGWSLFERGRPLQAVAAVTMPVVLIASVATLFNNRVITATGAFWGHSDCSYSDERPYAAFASHYFRPIDVEKQQFANQQAQRKHMVCGNLNETDWTRADMREALLIRANMRAAVFTEANLAGAIFEFALLRNPEMGGVRAFESRFHRPDLSRARLKGAELRETKFVEGGEPPLKWSAWKVHVNLNSGGPENGKQTSEARRDRLKAAPG